MLSMTLTDLSGRNLSGHTVEAFWHAVRHAKPLTIGLNCSFGAEQLRPHVKTLSEIADTLIMVYPNAGLPNELGAYDEAPATTAALVGEWARGGAGQRRSAAAAARRPAHIAAIADGGARAARRARCATPRGADAAGRARADDRWRPDQIPSRHCGEGWGGCLPRTGTDRRLDPSPSRKREWTEK